MRPLPRVRRSIRSRILHGDVITGSLDHYEVLAISPEAPADIVPPAYQIMLNQYLRVPPGSKKRLELLKALEDAYVTLKDPAKREKYDELTRPKIIVDLEPPAPVEVEPPPPPAVLAQAPTETDRVKEKPVAEEDAAAPVPKSAAVPARSFAQTLAAAVRLRQGDTGHASHG